MQEDMISQLTKSFMVGDANSTADAITFIEAPWGLNFHPTPAQAVVLKCFYGLSLDDKKKIVEVPDMLNTKILYRFTEKDFVKFLYDEGRVNTTEFEGKNFRELIVVAGRRGGKSVTSACIADYEMYKLIKKADPSDYYGFPPSTKICVMNVAPTNEQAEDLYGVTFSFAMNCPYLKDRMVNKTKDYFNLQTDDDMKSSRKKQASIVGISGGCASNALRGKNNIVVLMDEFAFFLDNGGRFSGSEVYRALTPSTATFKGDGKVVCISSPYAKYGAFWERYNQSMNEQDMTLMFKMYSAMMNPSVDSQLLKASHRRNKTEFMCEFGGEFSDSITSWFDEEEKAKVKIQDRVMHSRGETHVSYFMGIDLGLKNNGAGIAIVHRDDETRRIILDYVDVQYSGSSDVWDVENSIYLTCNKYSQYALIPVESIVNDIVELCKWYQIKSG